MISLSLLLRCLWVASLCIWLKRFHPILVMWTDISLLLWFIIGFHVSFSPAICFPICFCVVSCEMHRDFEIIKLFTDYSKFIREFAWNYRGRIKVNQHGEYNLDSLCDSRKGVEGCELSLSELCPAFIASFQHIAIRNGGFNTLSGIMEVTTNCNVLLLLELFYWAEETT